MSYQFLLYEVHDRVATITLNRPERHNALSQPLVDEIMAAVAEADADPEVRVLVVTGAGGRAFSAGYDIKDSAAQPKRTLAQWRARMQKDIKFTYRDMHLTQATQSVVVGSWQNIRARCWSFAIGSWTIRRAGTISLGCAGRQGSAARSAARRILGSQRGACVTAADAVGRRR